MEKTSIYDSPKRSPHIIHSINSPVRSIHPELMMGSINSQADFGHRTADFFDDTTDEESMNYADVHKVYEGDGIAVDGPRAEPSRQRRSGNHLGGTAEELRSQCAMQRASSPGALEAYMRANPPEAYGAQLDDHTQSLDGSFAGSIDELTTPSRSAQRSNLNAIKTRMKHRRSRSSTADDKGDKSPILGKTSTKGDHILNLHALSLRALQRLDDMELAHTIPVDRTSRLQTTSGRDFKYRSASAPPKKVSMVPPPINTSHHPLPDDVIRTPYPFLQYHRKDFGRSPNTATNTPLSTRLSESVMTLTIQRNNANSRARITTITIPANSDFSKAVQSGSSSEKEKHFAGLDFDDMEFFRQLNTHYRTLLGPYRFFAARSLSQITVSGSASRAVDAGYGWLHGPRSPRMLAKSGLSDTFSEEKLLKHFQNPKQGKARYAWVSWAHRIAAAPSSPGAPPSAMVETPLSAGSAGRNSIRHSLIRRADPHEGLEFVVSWSARRIGSVLAAVVSLSVAAMLLWVFLGDSSKVHVGVGPQVGDAGGGYRGAGDRVGTGFVFGICVLLLGLTGMGGWIGVSWLVL